MKRILAVTVLTVLNCFAISAQGSEQACQKLEIEAPELVSGSEQFQVKLNVEKSKQYENAQIRWKTIKNGKAVETTAANMIDVYAHDVEGGDSIIVLAETVDEKCRSFAAARILVQVGCRLPIMFDEYGKLDWSDEKARLHNVAVQFEKNIAPKDLRHFKLVVFLQFNKNVAKNTIKSRVVKILNYLSDVRLINKKRIAFVISEFDSESVSYQFLPPDYPYTVFENALTINGDDFAKLESLFQTKIPNSKK